MGNDEYTWSKKEKEMARKIYDTAYRKEMIQIKDEISKLISKYNGPNDIWKIHDYLTEKREEIDLKYDYRYSVIMIVFGRLFEEGIISEEHIQGLSEEKINRIKEIAEINKKLFKRNR
jgi:hypothetical protein